MPGGWSTDGRYIVYSNTGYAQIESEMQGDIMLIDLNNLQNPIPLVATPFHEANPAFSPDGRWMAFTSTESGRAELYLQAFDSGGTPRVSGERFLVSRTGAACLRWRRDGKELYFVGADGRVYAASVRLSAKPEIGTPAPLFTISLEARGAIHAMLGFDVSPDGTRFLVPVVTSPARSEIVVIQNWESAIYRP
jgi:serine/threonine-protein kinase